MLHNVLRDINNKINNVYFLVKIMNIYKIIYVFKNVLNNMLIQNILLELVMTNVNIILKMEICIVIQHVMENININTILD